MASITLTPIDNRYPEGTSVSAYFSDARLPSGAPTGSPVGSPGTVSGDALTLTGLTEGRSYWAVGQVGGTYRYTSFYVVPAATPAPAWLSKVLDNAGGYLSFTQSGTNVVRIGATPNLHTGRVGIEFSSDGASFVGIEHEPNFHINFYGSAFHIRSSTSAFNICAGDSVSGATATRFSVDTVNAKVFMNSDLVHQGGACGFNGATPVAKQLLATGASHTVDDVITVLQTFGLAKQS